MTTDLNPDEKIRMFFLCKFFEKENYALDFLDGRMYANKLSYFKSLEERSQDKRGDRYEGTIIWGQPGVIKIEINGHDLSKNLAAPVSMSSNYLLNEVNVVCMHAGYIKIINNQSTEDLSQITKQLQIPPECKEFGQYAVMIKNGQEFFDRVEKAAWSNDYPIKRGLVEYYDPDTFTGSFPGMSGAFRKQEKFKPEREYRIAFDSGDSSNNATVLDIGNIKDIAIRSSIDEINRNMKLVRSVKAT